MWAGGFSMGPQLSNEESAGSKALVLRVLGSKRSTASRFLGFRALGFRVSGVELCW